MTEALENIPTMTATDRYIEVAKREDPSKWELAYALRDAVDEHLPDEGGAAARAGDPGVNTGLYQGIAEVWEISMKAGLVEGDIKELSKVYRTAVAWPEETRVEGATYAAHQTLRDLDRRQQRLSKWVAQSSTGRLGRDDARRHKAELTRKKFATPVRPHERFDNAIRRNVKHWATGGKLTDTERTEAIGILQALISDIENEVY